MKTTLATGSWRWSALGARVLGGAVLGSAIVVTLCRAPRPDDPARHNLVELTQILPAGLDRLKFETLSLGPTEAVAQDVVATLNFDSSVYRRYFFDGLPLDIYAAYWSPARMPPREVASHTPDGCWRDSGWVCLEARQNITMQIGSHTVDGGEWRIFADPQGGRQHVIFWHFVGGRRFADWQRRHGSLSGAVSWWASTTRQLLHAPQRQFFVRLSSGEPIERFHADTRFHRLLETLFRVATEPDARR
ncbi:MAG: exosortase-associated EpsI family protein [Verrucomicrobia bacterium]|nr:exosortase-associated EpsI family protein [Verrucomicrobiota bacterium]